MASSSSSKESERALLRALELWRERRKPELAELVDRVSARVKRPPLGKGSLERMHARFLEVAKARDPLDVPRLVSALTNGRSAQLAARIAELAELPPDPRIATGLADLFATPPLGEGPTRRKVLDIVYRVLVNTADARVIARLQPYAERTEVTGLLDELERHVTERYPLARGGLDADEAKLVASLRGPVTASDLLAAIYAAPNDDGPREVYADWLLENGDPERGEFITLQLLRAKAGTGSTPRERLLQLDNDHWGGPLLKLATIELYERGFPSHCAARAQNQRTFVSQLSEPAWATVRRLSLAGFESVPPTIMQMPNFRQLTALSDVSLAFAAAAVRGRPPHDLADLDVEESAIMPAPHDLEDALGGEWPGLPRLRRLALSFPQLLSPAHVAVLVSGGGRQLQTLFIDGAQFNGEVATRVQDWLDPLTPTAVTRVTFNAGKRIIRIREPGAKEWREPRGP